MIRCDPKAEMQDSHIKAFSLFLSASRNLRLVINKRHNTLPAAHSKWYTWQQCFPTPVPFSWTDNNRVYHCLGQGNYGTCEAQSKWEQVKRKNADAEKQKEKSIDFVFGAALKPSQIMMMMMMDPSFRDDANCVFWFVGQRRRSSSKMFPSRRRKIAWSSTQMSVIRRADGHPLGGEIINIIISGNTVISHVTFPPLFSFFVDHLRHERSDRN